MSKKCCIPNCRLQKDDPGCLNLNFYQVPSNGDKREKWFDSIKNYFSEDIELKKYSYICALHFEPKCFNYGGLCKILRLKKTSCPTIFENYASNVHHMQYMEDNQVQNSFDNSDNVFNDSEIDMSSNTTTISLETSTDMPDTHNFSENIKKDLHENILNARQADLHNDQSIASNTSMYREQASNSSEVKKSFVDFHNTIQLKLQRNFINKSLANINLDSINYGNKDMVRKIIKNAQAEIKTLRQKRRLQSMRLYRAKKKVKNIISLISHVKQRNFISKKVSEILEVSIEN